MNIFGIIIGLVPSVGYGCMAPFSTKIGGTVQQKTLGITVACFLLGLIIFCLELPFGLNYSSPAGIIFFIISLISGVFWYFGSFFELKAITQAGVSKAMPFSMVGQFFITTLCSAFIFQNWLHHPATDISFGMTFLVIIFLGIMLISLAPNVEYKENGIASSAKKENKWSFLISIGISVVSFSLFFLLPELINNFGNEESWFFLGQDWVNPNNELFKNTVFERFDAGIMFPQTIGMIIPAFIAIIVFSKKNKTPVASSILNKKVYLNLIPGGLQAIGNLATIFSTLINGNAIASPLNQMSVVIATLFGIFYMKEKKPQPYMTTTIVGLALIAIGALMSGFAPLIINAVN